MLGLAEKIVNAVRNIVIEFHYKGTSMGIIIGTVVITLLAIGVLGCRLMPYEIGARIIPKSMARLLYAEPLRKNSK
jgi:hypothetical protein